MCQLLSLNDDRLAKRNHKVLSVEHFLRYLNKDVTIAAEDQSTIMNLSPLVLLQIVRVIILRSIPVIGLAVCFSCDIILRILPQMTKIMSTLQYIILNLLTLFGSFPQKFSKYLSNIVEQLTQYVLEITEVLFFLKLGDICIARTTIQSYFSIHKAAKLSYTSRGSFQIVHANSHGIYYLKKLH